MKRLKDKKITLREAAGQGVADHQGPIDATAKLVVTQKNVLAAGMLCSFFKQFLP